jgi:hypothetical protein
LYSVMTSANGARCLSRSPSDICPKQVSMTGNPVTAKHEKRPHANHLFAVSYVSFLGKAVTLKIPDCRDDECSGDVTPLGFSSGRQLLCCGGAR